MKDIKKFIPSKEQIDTILTPEAKKILSVMYKLSENREYISLGDIQENLTDVPYWKFQYSVYLLKLLELIHRKQRGLYKLTGHGKDYILASSKEH